LAIQRIGVIGAGTMGSGIAECAAKAGYEVSLFDVREDAIDMALMRITNRFVREVRKGRISQAECDNAVKRIRPAKELGSFREVDYAVEAATENVEIKKAIFKQMSEMTRPDVVLATNTSGLSITEIAAATVRPDMVIGTHYFNPVPVMNLVEIVRGVDTSDDTVEIALQVAEKMGKSHIFAKEAPLFVVNRILVPMLNEAIFVLQEGLASKEDIDKGMVLGANHPIGPLALCDMVGLDTLLFVAQTLYEETGDSKYRPAPLLKQMVRANHLGRKTGRGFYQYQG
jgi:3-hydroxybutyryl-CoA dehydrogenase